MSRNLNRLEITITISSGETEFEVYNHIVAAMLNATESMSKHSHKPIPKKIFELLRDLDSSIDGFGPSAPDSTSLELIAAGQRALKLRKRFKKLSKKMCSFMSASHIIIDFPEDNYGEVSDKVYLNANSDYLLFNRYPKEEGQF